MRRMSFLFAFTLLLAPNLATPAENWPEFRGPTGQGSYAGKNLPIEWSATKNIAWKTPIAGLGWSSPIVLDGKVYLTTAVKTSESKDVSLQLLCIDAAKGTQLWAIEVFKQEAAKAPGIHGKNSHASPTPITDGKRLYVHFGHQGTACLDLNGKIIWQNRDLRYSPVHGNGGTPILVDDRLIYSVDGSDQQFVVALNPADGKVLWKTDRNIKGGPKFSFSTPLAITVNGKRQVVSPASNAVVAYDPADGKEIWRATYTGYSVIPRPVFGHGMIFMSTGYNNPSLLAIRVDGTGDVTKTHVAWTVKKDAPHTPSPLLVGDELYMVSDKGFASCLDARTGKQHWDERAGGVDFSASPFYGDGKVYFQSEDGVTTVVRASAKHEVLATNRLEGRTFASYAAADSAIFLRTEKNLYRIQAR